MHCLRAAISCLFILISLIVIGSVSSGAEQEMTWSPPSLPEGYRQVEFNLWIPPALNKDTPLRGVLCATSYADGKNLYTDIAWRKLAEDERCACMLYKLQTKEKKLRLGKDKVAANLILASLDAFAKESGHPELTTAGVVLTGLSQGGWQAVAIANRIPNRVIAVVAIHEATPAPGRGPDENTNPEGWSIPQMHVMGGKCFLTPLIQPWVLDARKHGALWTTYLQPDQGHAKMGDLSLALLWIKRVINLRLPLSDAKSEAPALKTLSEEDGWIGTLTLNSEIKQQREGAGERPPPAITTVSTASVNAFSQALRGTGLWLPGKDFAEVWLEYATQPSKRP